MMREVCIHGHAALPFLRRLGVCHFGALLGYLGHLAARYCAVVLALIWGARKVTEE